MITKLKKHLSDNFSFLQEKKLLLAVSGGIDSMFMADALYNLNYDVSIAHCNFKLRGTESDEDEAFVRKYADDKNLKLFVTHFDTKSFSEDNKISIQLAARQLRYIWFYQLLEKHELDFIITAHHLDDSLETFLINISRGTGLEGLVGIPETNNKIIRPLLLFSRDEIEDYMEKNSIEWREDSSNASNKYLRNKLRHDVIPVLKSLNPSFNNSFQETLIHLQQAQTLVEDASVLVYKQVITEKSNQKHFNIQELLRLPNYRAYLYQWLSPFGFTAWADIYSLVNSQSGKQIYSEGFRLLKDRDTLILEPNKEIEEKTYKIENGIIQIEEPVKLKFLEVSEILEVSNKIIYVDREKLKFPLHIRKWKEGDYFYPFGMEGKKKKLSKHFKDLKLSLSEKEDYWVLTSENQIIWIIGNRADERFKINNTTNTILKIEVL